MDPSGRLELTWTNKHLRLLTTEAGGYEWVDPADPRVSEVRLLHEVASVGEVGHDGGDNLLIEGDALHALTALNRIPELARRYAGQVRLVYIDPPFNTGQAFANYDDNLALRLAVNAARPSGADQAPPRPERQHLGPPRRRRGPPLPQRHGRDIGLRQLHCNDRVGKGQGPPERHRYFGGARQSACVRTGPRNLGEGP